MTNVDPKFYYGLHFGDGVAEYKLPDGSVQRKYISNDTAKKMNSTFVGKPLKINHPGEDIDFKNLKSTDVDGWVIDSFFNKKDGKHWAKILVLNPLAEQKIKEGWTLSNGYHATGIGAGGEYQGVPYDEEITDAVYEHLALVSTPRYEYSKILTEEEFEAYNSEKESELGKRFINTKGEENIMAFKLFRNTREEVKKADDFKGLSVELPKSKKEMEFEKIVNMADEEMIKRSQNPDMFCVGNEKVKMENGETSTVAELIAKLAEAEKSLAEYKSKAESEAEGTTNADEIDDVVEEELDSDEEVDTDNSADEEEEKSENESSKEEDKKVKNSKGEDHFKKILNAEKKQNKIVNEIVISRHGVDLGKQRYGSGK